MAIVAVRLAMQARPDSHRGLRTMAGRLYPNPGPELPEGAAQELYEAVACVGMQFMGHLSEVDLQQARAHHICCLSQTGCVSAVHFFWSKQAALCLRLIKIAVRYVMRCRQSCYATMHRQAL